jgi:hypothetical protein
MSFALALPALVDDSPVDLLVVVGNDNTPETAGGTNPNRRNCRAQRQP